MIELLWRISQRLQRLLDQSDISLSARTLFVWVCLVSIASGGIMHFLRISPVICCAISLGMFCSPFVYVLCKRDRRIQQINGQLPEALDVMSQAIRAGHSLASVIQLVSEQLPEPLGSEFAEAFHQQHIGVTVGDSLLNMAWRTGHSDVRLLVATLILDESKGEELARALDRLKAGSPALRHS